MVEVLLVGRRRDDDPVVRALQSHAGVELSWTVPDAQDLDERIDASDVVVSRADPLDQPGVAARVLGAGRALWLRQPLAADEEGLLELDRAVSIATSEVGVDSRICSAPVADAARAIAEGAVGVPFAVHYDVIGDAVRQGTVDEAIAGVLHLLPGTELDVFASSTPTADELGALTITLGIGESASATLIIAPSSGDVREELRLRGTRGSLTAGRSRGPSSVTTASTPAMNSATCILDFIEGVRDGRPHHTQNYKLARLAHRAADAAHRSASHNSSIHVNDQD